MPKQKTTEFKIGLWHAIRDIFVASMNKGQFPLAIAGAVGLALILKMPEEAVAALAHRIMEKLDQYDLVGWLLFVFTILAWAFISKRTRKIHFDEIERIGKEKSALQKRILGNDAPSSKP